MTLFPGNRSFKGGVHPPEKKSVTENLPFEILPMPRQISVPILQHLGKPAKAVVKKGSEVKAGEIIAEQQGFISSSIHSPASGTVLKIATDSGVNGFPGNSIVIQTKNENQLLTLPPLNPDTVTPPEIIERVKAAGIVGQGGAAFPTYVKLSPPEGKIIDTVILNGCECEPYLTRDYRLMMERTDDVITGLLLIMRAIGVKKGIVAVEDNKPEAIAKLTAAAGKYPGIYIDVLRTKYPQGAEKMLIKAVKGREVPPGKLPFDAGVSIQNIGTAVSIFDAVIKGEPQITAALTVSGGGVNIPKNLIVPVGTSLKDILDFCGGVRDDAARVIVGGPMMGIAQFDFSAPVMKATSGILVLTEDEVRANDDTPCLRCGMCVDVCPVNLLPTRLVRLSQLDRIEDAEQLNITLCMECGTCAYTCPSNIPMVQWIRLGKQKVIALQKERQSAV